MTGIETRLKTISGLRTASYIPDQINPPMAVVGLPDSVIYNSTFKRGMMEQEVSVTVLTSSTIDRVGQIALGTYMDAGGAASVSLAIEGDRTLGAVVDDCYVESSRPLNLDEVNGLGFYGGRFTLKILAQGA